MYTCSKCKNNFEGQPARKQGKDYSILLCQTCTQQLNQYTANANVQRAQAIAERNRCKWCDDLLNEQNRARRSKEVYNSNLCVTCEAESPHRKWLEKCLTSSETILTYLANPDRQKKWKQTREEKRAKEKALKENLPQLISATIFHESAQMLKLFEQFTKFLETQHQQVAPTNTNQEDLPPCLPGCHWRRHGVGFELRETIVKQGRRRHVYRGHLSQSVHQKMKESGQYDHQLKQWIYEQLALAPFPAEGD
jgi:hypothetical protein